MCSVERERLRQDRLCRGVLCWTAVPAGSACQACARLPGVSWDQSLLAEESFCLDRFGSPQPTWLTPTRSPSSVAGAGSQGSVA